MADDIFIFALAAQGAWNMLKMEVAIRIHIRGAVVNYAEIALTKPKGNAKLKVRQVCLASLIFIDAGLECFRVKLLELLNDKPNRITVFVGQLMLASILLTIPHLVFKRIELNTLHRGLG